MLKTYKANHVWIDGKRYQKWGDKIYPGVTTVLSATKPIKDKMMFNNWQNKVGVERAENIRILACERGSEVHSCIEDYLVGKEKECSEQWQPFWDSIRPALINVSNVQLIEGALWHPTGFAGSVDCVGEWEGELSIIDWKTASKPKKDNQILDYKLQTSAYCAAVNRFYDLRINKAVIVIALENQPAQIFKITPEEIYTYWQQFSKRVQQYHSKFEPKKDKELKLKVPCKYCGGIHGKITQTSKKQYNKPDLIFKSLDCVKCGRYQSFVA